MSARACLPAVLLVVLLLAAPVPDDAHAPGRCIRGVASFYGRLFNGRAMANGHPFRMWGHTAASLALPLGTLVRVRNLGNSRAELVTIEDRGPYVRGRAIDLSQGTARRLGFEVAGLAAVEICRQ